METGKDNLARWWSQKYNLPPNDPKFLNRSYGAHLIEFFGDLFKKREELLEEVEDPLSEGRRAAIRRSIRTIENILDGKPGLEEDESGAIITGDPLIDYWERELAAGRMPDLTLKAPPNAGAEND